MESVLLKKEIEMSEVQESKTAVTYAESHLIKGRRVGEFLLQEFLHISPQLSLGDTGGEILAGPVETDSYSVLTQHEKKICFGLVTVMQRRIIAQIWLSSASRNATHKKWVLEVFGTNNVEYFKSLAQKLSDKFHVEIHVRLESEVSSKVKSSYYDF